MKKLYLIDKEFPYKSGDYAFIHNEYEHLKRNFDITIIVLNPPDKTEIDYTLVNDEQIIIINEKSGFYTKLVNLICFIFSRGCISEILQIIKCKEKIFQRIYRALMFGTAGESFYRLLIKKVGLKKNTDALVYFYWNDYHCSGFAMHKKRYPNVKFVARTHGYDLYDYRELYGKQFFKEQTDKKLDRLIFAAQYAKDYYLMRYRKEDCEKYPLCRIGVEEKQISDRQLKKKSFLLLSCSHAIAIKRVSLIIEGLTTLDNQVDSIRWVHIGDGNQLSALKELAKDKLLHSSSVEFEFMGDIPNDEVLKFYHENSVDCFITTTSTEGGSPVSVQEALSFGVPVIATAVGELPVMVDGNGVLLSDNPTPSEVGQAINSVINSRESAKYESMKRRSLELFHTYFDANNNFCELVENLVALCENRNGCERKYNEKNRRT